MDRDDFSVFLEKINNFSSLNEDIENFIKNKAVDFEKRDMSRTYLILNENRNFVAYFSLTLKVLEFNDTVSNKTKKRLHGASSSIKSIPVILIGQLGKNFNFKDEITGKYILESAMSFVKQIYGLVGCRICLVETLACESNQKVIDFYTDYGFVGLNKSPTDNFLQMYTRIK
jgi:hypothetical protein